MIEKRSFFEGMNGDISPRLLSDKAALNIMNARMTVSEHGRTGRLENFPGTKLVSQTVFPPYGTHQTIGTATDNDNSRLLFFNYNTFGDHGIYCYDPSVGTFGTIYAVLYDSQVLGGLGFTASSLIHSARVANGCLYWCEGTSNEPRRININAGIETNKAGTFPGVTPYQWPMSQSVLYWIRKQPALPLTGTKATDATYSNNFIKNEGFQFAWRYINRDYEITTMSAWSTLSNYNDLDDTFNYITIAAPLGEAIPNDVLQVDYIAKYMNGGKSFVIKSWNKNIVADEQAIYNHNNASISLSFNFYNNFTGIAIDDAYSVKQFDNLPIYAQTIEIARNRAFVANYTIGYDTPTTTSLTAAAATSSSGVLTAQWVKIEYNSGASVRYFLDMGSYGFFDVTAQPSPPPYPSTYAYGNMVFVVVGAANFALYILATYTGWINGIQYPGSSTDITGGPAVPGLAGTEAFKTGASYQLSVHFLDHAGRKCGILTKDALKVAITNRTYDQLNYTTGINWSLSNSNAVNEIPLWASYVSINITKCLTTRYFLQARVKNITYVIKTAAGAYDFATTFTAYAATRNGVAIDYTLLNGYGMGYVYAEGDLVNVYISTTLYTLSIVAQDGNWIICELQNLGTLGSVASAKQDVLFQPFTPYRPSTSEPYYEVAQIYKITNPGTVSRTYSTLAGTIGGDITLLTRNDGTNDYLTENMSPNDKFYQQWNTDSGRPNFIDTIGQQTKTNYISWSDTFIQGSKVNGLSTFEASNQTDTYAECGDITKLQSGDKVADEQGTIMLAICENRTVSMYLGEVQMVGSSSGNAFVAQSTGVIGTKNTLKRPFGTTRPESVFEYDGLIFFIDLKRESFVQYSNAGLEPVSRYNMSRFFQRYCNDFTLASTANINNINGFNHIRANVNPATKEILVTFPGLIYENYANVLPSYSAVPSYATSIVDRFDIYDQLGKTMSFMFEENKWGSNYQWMPEWSDYLNNKFYGFKNGYLYIHDADTANWNNVYGVDYPVRICFAGNLNPSALKILNNICVESNAMPNFTVAYTDWPNVQITDLAITDPQWEDQEGLYYADFLKDRLSPNTTGTADQKLHTGDDLTDIVIKIMVEFQQYDNLFYCNFIDIGYSISRGQKQILNPINT